MTVQHLFISSIVSTSNCFESVLVYTFVMRRNRECSVTINGTAYAHVWAKKTDQDNLRMTCDTQQVRAHCDVSVPTTATNSDGLVFDSEFMVRFKVTRQEPPIKRYIPLVNLYLIYTVFISSIDKNLLHPQNFQYQTAPL